MFHDARRKKRGSNRLERKKQLLVKPKRTTLPVMLQNGKNFMKKKAKVQEQDKKIDQLMRKE